MRRPRWLLIVAFPMFLLLGAAALIAIFVFRRAQSTLDDTTVQLAQQGRFPADMRPLTPLENPGFEAIDSTPAYLAGAYYQGKFYLSGSAGLSIFAVDGTLLKRYRVGMDLPAAPLGAMVVGRLREAGEAELLIATHGEGVLIFTGSHREDGSGSFRQLRPNDPDAREITALLPLPSGELLIGTGHAGLLVYQGSSHGGADSSAASEALYTFNPQFARLPVTALAADSSGFWVGTRDRGVFHWHAGQTDVFRADEPGSSLSHGGMKAISLPVTSGGSYAAPIQPRQSGSHSPSGGLSFGSLPDNQVESIAVLGERVYVGTPVGVEEFLDGRPGRTLGRDVFAQALYVGSRDFEKPGFGKETTSQEQLLIGSIDQGIQRISLAAASLSRHRSFMPASNSPIAETAVTQFIEISSAHSHLVPPYPLSGTYPGEDSREGTLYAVTPNGLDHPLDDGSWAAVTPPAQSIAPASKSLTLLDHNISALAFDPDGRLWIGYFDQGLDIASADQRSVDHYEDDHLFCINRIVLDPRRNTMAVATANGLTLFDAKGKPRQTMTKKEGLIADHVTDVAFRSNEMVVATPAGLTFLDGSGARSLYAFEGLVNNHVYALGTRPESGELLAGTLGGISVLVNDNVQRNLTATNSGLKHNWVTAILPVEPAEVPSKTATWMVGTYGAGVMQLTGDGQFTPMDGVTREMVINPNAMFATRTHIFAGSLGQGLWVWSRPTARWSQVRAGLPSENVTAIAERDGQIYVGTDNGLVRIAEHLLP